APFPTYSPYHPTSRQPNPLPYLLPISSDFVTACDHWSADVKEAAANTGFYMARSNDRVLQFFDYWINSHTRLSSPLLFPHPVCLSSPLLFPHSVSLSSLLLFPHPVSLSSLLLFPHPVSLSFPLLFPHPVSLSSSSHSFTPHGRGIQPRPSRSSHHSLRSLSTCDPSSSQSSHSLHRLLHRSLHDCVICFFFLLALNIVFLHVAKAIFYILGGFSTYQSRLADGVVFSQFAR
ncbi:unnamed protein product, partial [Closterium sp. NIES-65]